MEKDSNLIIRVNKNLKSNVNEIISLNNYTMSELINAFLCYVEDKKMIPQELHKYLPNKHLRDNKCTIAEIKKYLSEIIEKSYKDKIKKAYLFGSYARGEENSKSDIDLRIEILKGFTIHDLVEIEDYVTNKFKKSVDIVTKKPKDLDQEFYNEIKKEEICLYER